MLTFKLTKQSTKRMVCCAILAVGTMLFSGCSFFEKKELSYAPWPDLSSHFNLNTVKPVDKNIYTFNTYEISQGKIPWASEHISNRQYNATVLGTGVVVRSTPSVGLYNKICHVNTGENLLVYRSEGYKNGKYWSYVRVNSGYYAGCEGYICTDYIVESRLYEMFQNYILRGGSNMTIKTESKYLHAIADILIKFQADIRHPNLTVNMLNTQYAGNNMIVVYQIRDLGIVGNNSMVAFVQFFPGNNDYRVLGVVPGTSGNQIIQRPDGSLDISFNNFMQ